MKVSVLKDTEIILLPQELYFYNILVSLVILQRVIPTMSLILYYNPMISAGFLFTVVLPDIPQWIAEDWLIDEVQIQPLDIAGQVRQFL